MWDINKKYCFKGTLELKTALHIGGGRVNVTNTDSPIVRTPEGSPFIPGSSFKGAFRSTVEKLATSIPGLNSCQLIQGPNRCPTARQDEFAKEKQDMNEEKLIGVLERDLCNTCKLFGSPFTASKIIFHDLMITSWPGVTQVRDGVVIDRDSEHAKDGLKYDFEVVSPTSTFDLEIWLEIPRRFKNPSDLGLTCLGLNEFRSGTVPLGGIKSRGLGHCKITNLEIYVLDLEEAGKKEGRLKKYLLGTTPQDKMDKITELDQFIETAITSLLNQTTSSRGGA